MVVVTLQQARPVGTQVTVEFSALSPAGEMQNAVTADFASISPTRLATLIKQRIIAVAASVGQTITPREIWIVGLGDEQAFVRTSAPFTTTANTLQTVPGTALPLAPNAHYKFKFVGAYTAAAGTTGLGISVSGPASPSLIRFVGEIGESVTAKRIGAGAAYDVAILGLNSGAATPLPFVIEGSISTGNDVTLPLVLRARSEVNGSQVSIPPGAIGELFFAA